MVIRLPRAQRSAGTPMTVNVKICGTTRLPDAELAASLGAWAIARADREFQARLEQLLERYVGRPTPLYEAARLSERTRSRVFLKREDLLHTGAHKINNALGQALLAA